MSLYAACGTLQTGTAAAGNTVSVTSISGFDPSVGGSVLLLAWSGRTATGQAEGDHKFGMGYAVSTSDRGGATSQSDNTPTTMAADNQVFDDSCIKMLTIAGAVDGAMDFDAWLSNGFRVIIDDAFAADYIINWLVINGPDLQAASATVTSTDPEDAQNITSIGFQPTCALVWGAGVAAVNSTDTWSNFCFGVVDSALTNYVMAGASQDAVGTSVTMSYCKSVECYASMGIDVIDSRCQITAWLSNGFTWNEVEVVGASTIRARVLCLRGIRALAGDFTTATNTTPFTESTSLGVGPVAAIFASHCKGVSTADTSQAVDERSIGFAVDASNRNVAAIIDKDASTTADIGVAQNTTSMYANQSTAATVVIEGLMDYSTNADNGTLNVVMDDADPSAAFVFYLAFSSISEAIDGRPFGNWGHRQLNQLIVT